MWSCPTLVIWDHLVPPARYGELEALPEFRHVSWRLSRFLWKKTLQEVYRTRYEGADYAGGRLELSRRVTRALHEAGARLVTGTDVNFVGVFPGTSLHRDLELLAGCGLSPYEVVRCATASRRVLKTNYLYLS